MYRNDNVATPLERVRESSSPNRESSQTDAPCSCFLHACRLALRFSSFLAKSPFPRLKFVNLPLPSTRSPERWQRISRAPPDVKDLIPLHVCTPSRFILILLPTNYNCLNQVPLHEIYGVRHRCFDDGTMAVGLSVGYREEGKHMSLSATLRVAIILP
jgi:hypothetical protein